MIKHKSNLEKILGARWMTIQESTFLDALDESQRTNFDDVLRLALMNRCNVSGMPKSTIESKDNERLLRRVTMVYRGDNFDNLAKKLFSDTTDVDESKLLGMLFYFGDKAKHYYRINHDQYKKLRWLAKIEDHSLASAKVIFSKIKAVLKKKSVVVDQFKLKNPEFSAFFLASENVEYFSEQVIRYRELRDYYLYFLHTAGKIGIGDGSVLVSTSSSYEVAQDFAGKDCDRYIMYYVVPAPFSRYCVSSRHLHYRAIQRNKEIQVPLPTYRGISLYPNQYEVSVKGALFPHHILGVMIERRNGQSDFVVNPHIFDERNSIHSILTGLQIDQSDFEQELNKTGYKRGVQLGWDLEYSTILPNNLANETETSDN